MISVSLRSLMRHIIYSNLLLSSPIAIAEPHLVEESLEKEFKAYGAFQQLTVRFEQVRTVKAWGSEIRTSGKFFMSKSQKPQVLWEIQKPTYTAMKITDQGVFVNTESREAKWTPVQNDKIKEQIQNIFAWMSFDVKKILTDFDVSKIATQKYELVPKNKTTHFNKIKIEVGSDKTVKSITMFEHNQDRIHIVFKETKRQ